MNISQADVTRVLGWIAPAAEEPAEITNRRRRVGAIFDNLDIAPQSANDAWVKLWVCDEASHDHWISEGIREDDRA